MVMKAALKTEDGRFEISNVQTPELPGPDWAVVRVKVAGICGTDLRHWEKPEPENVGKIMGHEMAGEVVEIGPSVRNIQPGDRVVVETLLGDDDCDWCRVQQYNLCPNLYKVRKETVSRNFAEFVIAPSRKCYKLPDNISFEEATLLDSYSVCLHAMQLSGLKVNDKVAVIGAGPIGLGQLQLAKIAGADVIVTDVVDSSLKVAQQLGADVVVNSETQDAKAAVVEFTRNRGCDITFECAGGTSMPQTLPAATDFTRIGGAVVIVGGFDQGKIGIELEWQRIQLGEIRLIPSASYSFWGIDPEMQICIDLMSKGKLKAKPLITHRFQIDEINQAFEVDNDKKKTGAIFVALTV